MISTPAAAGPRRPMRHPAALLVLGPVAFVLVGWGVGGLWPSGVGPADLDAVRNLAGQRSAALIDAALAVTWAGRGSSAREGAGRQPVAGGRLAPCSRRGRA